MFLFTFIFMSIALHTMFKCSITVDPAYKSFVIDVCLLMLLKQYKFMSSASHSLSHRNLTLWSSIMSLKRSCSHLYCFLQSLAQHSYAWILQCRFLCKLKSTWEMEGFITTTELKPCFLMSIFVTLKSSRGYDPFGTNIAFVSNRPMQTKMQGVPFLTELKTFLQPDTVQRITSNSSSIVCQLTCWKCEFRCGSSSILP